MSRNSTPSYLNNFVQTSQLPASINRNDDSFSDRLSAKRHRRNAKRCTKRYAAHASIPNERNGVHPRTQFLPIRLFHVWQAIVWHRFQRYHCMCTRTRSRGCTLHRVMAGSRPRYNDDRGLRRRRQSFRQQTVCVLAVATVQ